MASSVCRACRLSSKLLPASPWRMYATTRGFRTSAACRDAQNFNMPALSPTMTEGTISSWKIKEGESFSAGDVILEIETDKASMDVEAQDDGILAKIMVQAGKSPVKVGSRIAVLADPGDDVKTLQIPSEDPMPPGSGGEEAASAATEHSTPKQSAEAPKSKEATVSMPSEAEPSPSSGHHGAPKTNFIPSPGITHLLHANNLEMSDVKGTGPKGRVLKGDILAHIGKIDKSRPKQLADDLAKLSKLDLSNITPAKAPEKKEEAKPEKPVEKAVEEGPKELEIQTAVSMRRVIATQKKFERLFKVQRSWSSFVGRAILEANAGLPPSKAPATTSQDALFDEILSGSPAVPKKSPYLVAEFKHLEPLPAFVPVATTEADVIDVLTGAAPATRPARTMMNQTPAFDAASDAMYMLSVVVPLEDEMRGSEFLSRVKSALEDYPEKLLEE